MQTLVTTCSDRIISLTFANLSKNKLFKMLYNYTTEYVRNKNTQ